MFYLSGTIYYYNEYCSGSSPCETSDKGELNTTTGGFTIFNAQFTDTDYYYYTFYISAEEPNTGTKYEINLHIGSKEKY